MSGFQDDVSDDSSGEWYPGKMIGFEKTEGEWYPGKLLGRKKTKSHNVVDLFSQQYPIVWNSIDQLKTAVALIQSVDGVLAALQVCVNIVHDDLELATAIFHALSRIGKGNTEKMTLFGEKGACERVVTLLHFYINSYFDADGASDDEKEKFYLSSQNCLMAGVQAVENLSAGCKKNRHRLARAGTCFYLVNILRCHCRGGSCAPLLESTLNAIWQLSFNNKLSRKCFRDSGCENVLWTISANDNYSQPIRHRALSVLRWLKTQLVDDIAEIIDPRTLSGALLLAVSDISMTSVSGNSADSIKIATESFHALENVLISGDTSRVVQDAIESLFLPATIVMVTRRILRFYKRIFHENKEGLYRFLLAVCTTVSCLLSKQYRQERRNIRTEDDENSEIILNKIASLLPSPAVKRTECDNVQSYSYWEHKDAIMLASPLEKRISVLENKLISVCARQIKQAGGCKLFARALALFVSDDEKKQPGASVKNSKRSMSVSSDPLSFFNSAADTFTKGFLSGLQEVQSGLNMFSDKGNSIVNPADVPFPDSLAGKCIEALCDCIRLLTNASMFTRLHVIEEKIWNVCNDLLLTEFASKIENLYLHSLCKIGEDFRCAKLTMKECDAMTNFQAVVLIFNLKVLHQENILLASSSQQVLKSGIAVMCEALECVSSAVSSYGSTADSFLREMDAFRLLFDIASNKFLSHDELAEGWLSMCTNIALARIESKDLLGEFGACEICMTVLRLHSLRPKIVQCSLWAICVLIGNHPRNVRLLLSIDSKKWGDFNVKKYLQSIINSKGQTMEARDHASLICCSIELYEKQQKIKMRGKQNLVEVSDGANGVLVDRDAPIFPPLPFQYVDEEADEFIQIFRRSNCKLSETIKYDMSCFPRLNMEPFFFFEIIGVHSLEKSGSIDVDDMTEI